MQNHSTSEVEQKEDEEEAGEAFLSEEERDLLVKYLARDSFPLGEIAEIAGVSTRTATRILQRLGVRRRRPVPSSRGCHARRLSEILTRYYALEEVTPDALWQLAREEGLSMKALFRLIEEHVSPSRWAIRACLACGGSAVTPSPADRYCPACRNKVKKIREKIDDRAIYE